VTVLSPAVAQWRDARRSQLMNLDVTQSFGKVSAVSGTLVRCRLPRAAIGELCRVAKGAEQHLLAEVVGFEGDEVLVSALGSLEGVEVGGRVAPLGSRHFVQVGEHLLGAVLDGFGQALHGGPSAFCLEGAPGGRPVIAEALPATERPVIEAPLVTGLRAIDSALLLGEGQRIGLFAGAGCGKTTLLAELARNVENDVIVFGLIGERGRELREFLDHELDDELKRKSVLVCATSDRSSMERARAAFTATTLAEGFREQGKRVLLLIDSLTRFARAQREIGLAAGEPLGRGGLPPSVYTLLPRLVERAGRSNAGSITAIYTVLIEQDSMNDPVADEVRSLLDGHIVLSRKIAERGHYPAIDVLASISRIYTSVASKPHQRAGARLRQLMAAYKEVEMLIRLGEYQPGADPVTDLAVNQQGAINAFLQQSLREPSDLEATLTALQQAAPAEAAARG